MSAKQFILKALVIRQDYRESEEFFDEKASVNQCVQ